MCVLAWKCKTSVGKGILERVFVQSCLILISVVVLWHVIVRLLVDNLCEITVRVNKVPQILK